MSCEGNAMEPTAIRAPTAAVNDGGSSAPMAQAVEVVAYSPQLTESSKMNDARLMESAMNERERNELDALRANKEQKNAAMCEKMALARDKVAVAEESSRKLIEDHATMEEMQRKEEEERELKAFRQRLEETRERKRRAAELHEQKVIEAVCAASLLEYKEHQRIEKQLHDAEEEIERLKEIQQAELNRKRQEAARQKLIAQQTAENAKIKAQELAQKAATAINAYKDTETHRQEALATLTEQECDRELQAQLHQLKLRQEAATLRRIQSERAAQEAKERAARIREEAIAKVKQVRELSKKKITTELTQEEQLRTLQYESQLHQLQAVKEEATQRRIDRELQAKAAQERAVHLREEAFAKVKQVRELSKTNVSSQLTREDELRELEYQSQLQALQSVKDAATIHRQELEQAAILAKEKAELLRQQAMAKSQELHLHHDEIALDMTAQEKQTQAQPAEVTEEKAPQAQPTDALKPSLYAKLSTDDKNESIRQSDISQAPTVITHDTMRSSTSVATRSPSEVPSRRSSRGREQKEKKCTIM